MSFSHRIETKLRAAFAPERLVIVNESHQHAGHQPGMDGSGETHLRIRIVAAAFAGMGRVDRHRAITALLGAEFEDGLHALAIEAAAPGEPVRF